MDKNLLEFIKKLSEEDKKTLSQKALKVSEESGELAKVVLPFDNAHGTTHRFISKNRILEECSDIILTAISIPYSLGYTDEDIIESLYNKAIKWQGIQNKESYIKYPIPYELHITVLLLNNNDFQLNLFKDICYNNGLKPIIIDLENGGDIVLRDVMTSSHFFGDNAGAYNEAIRIEKLIENFGLNVIRTKIETVPWHPAAPQIESEKMPENSYFESHISCLIDDNNIDKLNSICFKYNIHKSRNAFKKLDDGKFIQMITLRDNSTYYEAFKKNVELVKEELSDRKIQYDNVIIEFSLYDTKLSHDNSWVNKK